MESFQWDTYFETGLVDVDEQHFHLVGIINRFGNLRTKNTIAFDDIETVFNELIEYAHYHFKEEEAMMMKIGIDQRHLLYHIEAHEMFLNDVIFMRSGISKEDLSSSKHLLDFLIHWLAYHILGIDQNMARQIAAIESGVNPNKAYDLEEIEKDKATKPLLAALNGLFEQVSTRNKELVHLNQSLEEIVRQRTKELSEANRHLEELSLTDVLTGLPNRRHAMRRLAYLWEESTRTHSPLVCMMLDADYFKEINDTYGHDTGDFVLAELATTLQDSMRNDDIVCRLGGDEFFIICPNTNKDDGIFIGEFIQKTVSALRIPTGGKPWHGSISIGVASRSADMTSYEALVKAADKGVYAAKEDGKNCVRYIG